MIDDLALLTALRARLLSVQVCTTGTTTLGATGTGFSRPAGSFVNDGFVVGMEVTPSGFTDDTPVVINSVTDTEITLLYGKTNTAQADAGGRSLTVGVPAIRSFENVETDRIAQRWYLDEDYIPGEGIMIGAGSGAELEYTPMYVVKLEGMSNVGPAALFKVSAAVLQAFPPGFAFTLASSDIMYVRSDMAPWRSQAVSRFPGTSETAITIPLWGRTNNLI